MLCEHCGQDHEDAWSQRIGQLTGLVMFVFDKKRVLKEEGLDVCLNVAAAALRSMEPEERTESVTAFCEALRDAVRSSLQ